MCSGNGTKKTYTRNVFTLEDEETLIDFYVSSVLLALFCQDDECLKKWSSIRDYYIRKRGKPLGTGTSAEFARKRMAQLLFLEDTSVAKRKSQRLNYSNQNPIRHTERGVTGRKGRAGGINNIHIVTEMRKESSRYLQNIRGSLDQVNLTDRTTVFVAGAVATALEHDLSEITLSRSSIRRSKREERQKAAAAEQKQSNLKGPCLLHWDDKLLLDIGGSKVKVDRIAIILTGNGQEKLLGILKIVRETGKAQAQACIEAIKKLNMKSQIKGLVFNTRASNNRNLNYN